jgi:hypothetical protein
MSLMDLFKSGGTKPSVETLKTRHTDEFADSVLLELKSVATDAVKRALEARETRYMKTVLDDSYFVLDSLVITPNDREVAQKFDDFLTTHEAVDPQFRRQFFQQVIQREYRSSRGSSVRVPAEFEATVQLGKDSLETLTSEEGFQISLKGRRISFTVEASLSGPLKREASAGRVGKALSAQPTATTTATREPAAAFSSRANDSPQHGNHKVEIQLTDARGSSQHTLVLPALIGREPGPMCEQFGLSPLRVQSTYVSRQQLVLLDVMGRVYYFLPDSASLSCVRADGLVLEKLQLYPLDTHTATVLRSGIPPEGADASHLQGGHTDYAVIQISLASGERPIHEGTPRPRAVA